MKWEREPQVVHKGTKRNNVRLGEFPTTLAWKVSGSHRLKSLHAGSIIVRILWGKSNYLKKTLHLVS